MFMYGPVCKDLFVRGLLHAHFLWVTFVSARLVVCFQNLCSSRHRAVHPEAAGERAVTAARARPVPYVVRSFYICLQAALQHLPGVTGPPTLRPAPGDRCSLEKSA